MKKLYTLAVSLSLAIALQGQAVKVEVAPNLKISQGSDVWFPVKKNQILKTLQKGMNEYAQAATLRDPERNRVTSASVERFHNLFSATATIVDDFMEYPSGSIPYKDYSAKVYSLMPLQGVQARIDKATLKEIIDDPAGFYVLVVDVEKSLFNYLTSAGKLGMSSGRVFKQEFRFDIPKANLDRIRITKIKGDFGPPPEDYYRFLTIAPGLSFSFPSLTTSPFWDANHDDASLQAKEGIGYSFGIEWATNQFINPKQATNKKLGLSLGLRYSNYAINTELSDFSIVPFDTIASKDGNVQPYLRIAGPIQGKEKLHISVLELPVGLSYQLMKKSTTTLLVNGRVVPAISISGKGDFSGDGTYDGLFQIQMPNGSLMPTEFRILEEGAANPERYSDPQLGFGPYDVGNKQPIDHTSTPTLNSVAVALQLEPTVYFDFGDYNPVWGIMAGVSFTYYLNSFVKHDAANSDILRYSSEFNNSLLQHYAEKSSLLAVGLRIGIYHKLVTEP